MSVFFRNVEHQLCIVLDKQLPKLLYTDADEDANALLCYGYVDKSSGLTYEILCIASYINGDYTIVNENKKVSAKVRAEKFQESEIIPINNAAIMKRFENRIKFINEAYYDNSQVESIRKISSLDKFRHPFYPDDVHGLLLVEGLKPETVWVRLSEAVPALGNEDRFFTGTLLNTPFEPRYNLSEGDDVYLIVSENNDICFVATKPRNTF